MISQEAQGRLDRILAIQGELIGLENELEQLLAGTTDNPAAEVAGKPEKHTRACSICDKPGHDVRKCPDGKGMHPDNPKNPADKPKGTTKAKVAELRNQGATVGEIAKKLGLGTATVSYHFTNLKKEEGGISTPRAASEPLTAEQYADLRSAMHDKEFQSASYSLTKKLRPAEVNNAVRSSGYRDYLESR